MKKHYKYLLIIPIYLLAFFMAERVVPDDGFVSYLPLDDRIPFMEAFVIPYVLWYPLLAAVGIVLMIKDGDGFARYMTYIGVTFFSILLFDLLFPNRQLLRPETVSGDGIFAEMIKGIYSVDTNTNVLPSMHVVGCVGASVAVCLSESFGRVWRASVICLSVIICASTVLIKQHSVLDVITALPYGGIVAVLCYKRSNYKWKKLKRSQ